MKQVFKTGKDTYHLLNMIYSIDRAIIPINLMCAVAKAAEPFIPITGTAYILDSLLRQEWKLAAIQAGTMILLMSVFGVILDYLKMITESKSMTINRLCNGKILLKAISLDYATFEDKKTLEEFTAADYNVSRHGGFGSYMLKFSEFVEGAAGFVIALTYLVQLCQIEGKGTGFLGFVTSKEGSFLCMGLLVLSLLYVYTVLSKRLNEKNISVHYEMMDANQKVEYFDDQLPYEENTAKDIRLYQLGSMIYREWKKYILKIDDIFEKFWKIERKFLLTSSALNDLVLLCAYLFVVAKTVAGALSLGYFTRYIGVVRQMNSSLRVFVESVNGIQLCQSYLTFYTEFIKKKNQLDSGSLPVEKRKDNEYEIEFHDVSFCYPGTDDYCLKHVNITLDMKKRFAVVGRNGAGKTTFIKLLCRLYDVTDGYITLNGVDIRKYDYKEYLGLFAAVFQDFSLFSISVKDNIACSQTADDKKIWEVLECAGIKERVEKMPQKTDNLLFYEMGDGENISGGEAQKLAIARAIYKDAPFVILDEPTAALDPVSEYDVYSRFHEMVHDKTSIYISHRMSSCRFCDDILVFDQGNIVQQGSHKKLMSDKESLYAKLWNAQAKYYGQEELKWTYEQ